LSIVYLYFQKKKYISHHVEPGQVKCMILFRKFLHGIKTTKSSYTWLHYKKRDSSTSFIVTIWYSLVYVCRWLLNENIIIIMETLKLNATIRVLALNLSMYSIILKRGAKFEILKQESLYRVTLTTTSNSI